MQQERHNLAFSRPDVVRSMLRRIVELANPATGYRDPQPQPIDPKAAPSLHDGCLAPWLD